jgi:hypothetical protein
LSEVFNVLWLRFTVNCWKLSCRSFDFVKQQVLLLLRQDWGVLVLLLFFVINPLLILV